MTFNVYIYPERALLLFVKRALENFPDSESDDFGEYLSAGSACVLALQAALEAITNRLLEFQNVTKHWDEMRFLSKIDFIAELEGEKIDWGRNPWQSVKTLTGLRNWIAHNKDPVIGLMGYKGCWIEGGLKGKIPTLDPKKELKRAAIKKQYDQVLAASIELVKIVGVEEEFEYLHTGDYEPMEIG